MADSAALLETAGSDPQQETESIDPKPQSDPSTEATPAQPPSTSSSSIQPPNANPSTPPPPSLISPPSLQPYPALSFRPATPPAPVPGTTPQFSPIPNPSLQQTQNYQTPGIPPPGVSSVSPVMMAPHAAAPASGAGPVQMSYVQSPFALPGQPMRPYVQMPNGYPAMPQPLPQGGMPPPGILRYPSPYAPMVRPMYPPRPPIGVGVAPPLMRPPISLVRGPIAPPIIRPTPSPITTQTEKPQTTVYVGKISSTIENDFMLSLLQLCGPVKSWKRAQDPTNGVLKGFGFCEFESAEGVLRALRLLSKLSIDGQELMLNVNQATRGYLEQYVQKKLESSTKHKEEDTGGADKGEENVPDAEKSEASKKDSEEDSKDKDKEDKEKSDLKTFGLVTDEDRQSDVEASEKLIDMIKERIKNKPLPPPPPPPQLDISTDAAVNLNVENNSRSRDGELDADAVKSEEKNEDDLASEGKPSSEHEKDETISPDRRRHDNRGGRDRDRNTKREKERELERYEREREQERAKREKDREYKIREDERRYKVREKEWESREREKEHWRKREREREKERAHERKVEIMEQEHDGDDGYKRRKYRSSDEDRRRRQREKEDDLADRSKEEEEIAEAKRRDDEQQQKKEQEEALRILSGHVANGHDKAFSPEKNNHEDQSVVLTSDPNLNYGKVLSPNGIGDESVCPTSDTRQNSNAPAKKLGFGLQGSGKRAAVPSVFNEDEDEDAHKEKKMRPLVPIDYSTEDQGGVHPSVSEAPPLNSAAATETAKRVSNVNTKEERPDPEKDRSRRSHSHRERARHHDEESRKENADHDRAREHRPDKARTPDNQKLLDAKQLIDMIPKTKNELFSYEINWAIYDKNELHERMRPWLAKKITEFLGEEEPTLVDYIVSSTQEHVKASEMLERLQAILDEEAEMFVLKMWRMLIFEIKKVETGLASRSKS